MLIRTRRSIRNSPTMPIDGNVRLLHSDHGTLRQMKNRFSAVGKINSAESFIPQILEYFWSVGGN